MIDGVWSFRLGEPDPVSVHFEMIGHGETPESFTVESGAMLLHATIDTSKVESFSIGKLKKTSTGRRLPIDDLSLFSILYALFRFRYSTLRWQSAPAPYGGMCCPLEQANPWGCPLQQSFHRTAQQSCLRH